MPAFVRDRRRGLRIGRGESSVERIGIISRLTIDFIFYGLDRLPEKGGEIRCANFVHTLGGGPVVSAIRLHAMGCPVKLGTYLGRSWESEEARRLLESYNFSILEDLYTGNGQPVTVSSVMSMTSERSITSYEEAVPLPSPQALSDFYRDCSIAVVPLDAGTAEILKKSGKRLVYDTNDFDVELPPAFLERLDIITPNAREAAALTGTDCVDGALEKLSRMGVRHPVIKTGASGCRTLLEGRFIHVPPPNRFHSVDTTGAGDNFLAGLLYGYQRGWDLPDCMAMANIWGELSTTAAGALGASFAEADVLEIFRTAAKCR